MPMAQFVALDRLVCCERKTANNHISVTAVAMAKAITLKFSCITSNNIGDAPRDLLHYFANIKTQEIETNGALNCDLYLIQDDKDREKVEPGSDWKQIWSGKRVSERRESFRLFQRIN